MEEKKVKQTWKQKILFYITAFFVLLGIFSVFSFLFLVPFVIDPSFTTIFMEFDEQPVLCVTRKAERKLGVSNCSWASCREGCTKEIYDCTQIHVDYKKVGPDFNFTPTTVEPTTPPDDYRRKRLIQDAAFDEFDSDDFITEPSPTGLMGNDSEWYYIGAKLFPNVKGCGYPPALNCTIFLKKYKGIGTNFSCYYSRVDPGLVISHLDMWQVYMNLVYAMAIPIPSFIVSVIYLTFAYFKIYNDDEEKAPLEKNAEGLDEEGNSMEDIASLRPASGALTPASETFREDLASFGHQLKVAMADEMSRDSFNEEIINKSHSLSGNLGKEMTTSISTSGGPINDI
ncbi:protein tipE [Agrilus planipennis]|uniref:Protein tipE n=1 Tax=Agrilus planipennis TaxID=224129 RepID=A0A1W4WKP3_AGRPL|nr:protein tipE [Agrilus planipennis]